MPYESFPAFESFYPSPLVCATPLSTPASSISTPTPSISLPAFHPKSLDGRRPATKRPRPSSPTVSTSSRSTSSSPVSPRSDPRHLLYGRHHSQRKSLAVACSTAAVAPGRRDWTENLTLNVFLKNTDGYFDDSDCSDDDEDEVQQPVTRFLVRSRFNPMKFLARDPARVPPTKKHKKDEFGSHFYL